jgi:arylformamidase
MQTLEREYSPSSCIGDIRQFTDAYAARSAAVRKSCPDYQVIQYGKSSCESLDFFPAPSPKAELRPLLVYIHGGYWQELSKDDHSFIAPALHKHGYSSVAIGYGLAPAASLSEIVDQVARAIAWIAKNCVILEIDSAAIHISGSSAGAHLAAMAGMTDWTNLGLPINPICSLILMSGVFDLRPLVLTYVNRALRMTEAEALGNSPLLQVDATQRQLPPILIAYGENETSEFKRQSHEFCEALRRKDYASTIQEIDGKNHFDLPFDLADDSTIFGASSLRHLGDAADRIR